jgi:hypothetical protein
MFPYMTNLSNRARTKNAASPRPLAGAGGWGVRVVTARKAAWLLGCSLTPDPKRGDCPRVLLECFLFGAFFASLHLCVFAFKQPCPVPVADALMAAKCRPPG